MIKQATIADAKETHSLQKLAYQSEAEMYNEFQNQGTGTRLMNEIERLFRRAFGLAI